MDGRSRLENQETGGRAEVLHFLDGRPVLPEMEWVPSRVFSGVPTNRIFQQIAYAGGSGNQVIGRMCKIIDKTCLSPTPTLEQHLMWDDIAILARYMLMLSFNNSLDVAAHLPYLFHVVTLLVATGPLSLRASTHGLVINIIHSLCTCSQLSFSGKGYNILCMLIG
ncbi:Neurofibromin 1 [Goodea atripinnis]|uniref:Neurofibromin 1 n=1 Tax=Goodea atripinnis TaxID=208336 RepID=A0ABV0NWC8_9TELE